MPKCSDKAFPFQNYHRYHEWLVQWINSLSTRCRHRNVVGVISSDVSRFVSGLIKCWVIRPRLVWYSEQKQIRWAILSENWVKFHFLIRYDDMVLRRSATSPPWKLERWKDGRMEWTPTHIDERFQRSSVRRTTWNWNCSEIFSRDWKLIAEKKNGNS